MFFFFNDTATTEIYTLSLHDALPISRFFATIRGQGARHERGIEQGQGRNSRRVRLYGCRAHPTAGDRKSTRLNSSHQIISYAVFCLKKKNKTRVFNRKYWNYYQQQTD